VLLLQPLYKKINTELEYLKPLIEETIATKTGLAVSYKNLSPSILTGLRVSGIEVYDLSNSSDPKNPLLTIKNIRLSWKLLNLIKGDIANSFTYLEVSGVEGSYIQSENQDVLDKILSNFLSPVKKDTGSSSTLQSGFQLPFDIGIKNFSVSYKDSSVSGTINLQNVKISTQKQTQFLNLDAKGKLLSDLGSAGFRIQCGISPFWDNSYAQVSLANINWSDITVPKLDLYGTYYDSEAQFHVIQNSLPFSIFVKANVESQSLGVTLSAEKLDPFALVTVKNQNQLLKKIKGSTISGLYELKYNFQTSALTYKVNGNIFTSPGLLGKNGQLAFQIEGTENTILVESLSVDSIVAQISAQGDFDIKTLQPRGIIEVKKIQLPSKNYISTEVYIEPTEQGFTVFLPQIYFGEQTLTAIQLDCLYNQDSFDIAFQAFDYSHSEREGVGKIGINGSVLLGNAPYIQAQLSTENIFLDSIAEIGLWSVSKDTDISMITDFLSPYIFSTDLFLSYDLKTKALSYNSPYGIIANTKTDDQMLLFALDGNESTFQLSRLEVLAAGQSLLMTANADLSDIDQGIFFGSSIYLNDMPFSASGMYMPNKYLKISGDYDFDLTLEISPTKNYYASLKTLSLPFALGEYLFSISLDTQGSLTNTGGWNVGIQSLEVMELSGLLKTAPKISLTGNFDNYGCIFPSIQISDTTSALSGMLTAGWTYKDSILEAAQLSLELQSNDQKESLTTSFDLSNPNHITMSDSKFISSVYFSGLVETNYLSPGHFLQNQKSDGHITGTVSLFGNLQEPTVFANIDDVNLYIGTTSVKASGGAELVDKVIQIQDFDIHYGRNYFQKVNGMYNLNSGEAALKTLLTGAIDSNNSKNYSAEIDAKALITSSSDFTVDILFPEISGSFFKTINQYSVHLDGYNKNYEFSAGTTPDAIVGVYMSDGTLFGEFNKDFIFTGLVSGTISSKDSFIDISNFTTDASYFSGLLNMPFFSLLSGKVVGNLQLSGSLSDLEFNGELTGYDVHMSVPEYVGENLVAAVVPIKVEQSTFSLTKVPVVAETSKGEVEATFSITLNEYMPVRIWVDVSTMPDNVVLGDYSLFLGSFSGPATCSIQVEVLPEIVIVNGDIFVEKLSGVITGFDLASSEIGMEEGTNVLVDLTINIGTKSQLFFPSKENPIVRGLVSQKEPLRILMDSRNNSFSFQGDLALRGGELLYLNRSFYLREGRIVFNETQTTFDPLINARAEIRERDSNGEQIRVILSVPNQRLSQLSPSLSSSPPRSEQEIMTLLGQIILADTATSENPIGQMLVGLVDYGAQITIFRSIENQLRDLLNFDIFSIHTLFLQNAMEEALNLNSNSSGNEVTFGNFLDNTTVYIGKYFGDTLYADALMHLSYDVDKEKGKLGGLVFQPEIGFELPTPFATIRWSIAPELGADWHLLVPYTSISLSWKFTY
jgi:hypothetical protein